MASARYAPNHSSWRRHRIQIGTRSVAATAPRSRAALDLRAVSKAFGAVQAVDDVSFSVESGTVTALIGPNGAGKSSLLKCISGFLRNERGEVWLDGVNITRSPAHGRARAGLATVFQTTQLLDDVDVLSNVMVGCHAWAATGFVDAMVRPPRLHRQEAAIREASLRALEVVGLSARATDDVLGLPYGQLRLLAIARVLAARPKVMLLDEPAAGLRANEKAQLIDVFSDLRDQGLTQLLVEHDMEFVGSLASRVVVMDRGQLIADGSPAQVRGNERVITAYLGADS